MSNFASSESVFLPDVRLQWFDGYKAAAGEINGKKTEPKFKVVALFERESIAAKRATAGLLAAATALWGDNARNVVQNISGNSKAVRNGNAKIDDSGNVRDEFKDMLFISASNKSKPQIVGPKKFKDKWVTISEDGRAFVDGEDVTDQLPWKVTPPYRGCYGDLKVQFVAGKAFKAASGEMIPNQVYAKFEAFQFVRDGEAFGNGPTSAEGFDEKEVETAAEASSSGDNLF